MQNWFYALLTIQAVKKFGPLGERAEINAWRNLFVGPGEILIERCEVAEKPAVSKVERITCQTSAVVFSIVLTRGIVAGELDLRELGPVARCITNPLIPVECSPFNVPGFRDEVFQKRVERRQVRRLLWPLPTGDELP